jgi:hypothetical protein
VPTIYEKHSASVLAQDPGSEVMQIEVVDDCSTEDDPKAVVEELGQGSRQFLPSAAQCRSA